VLLSSSAASWTFRHLVSDRTVALLLQFEDRKFFSLTRISFRQRLISFFRSTSPSFSGEQLLYTSLSNHGIRFPSKLWFPLLRDALFPDFLVTLRLVPHFCPCTSWKVLEMHGPAPSPSFFRTPLSENLGIIILEDITVAAPCTSPPA